MVKFLRIFLFLFIISCAPDKPDVAQEPSGIAEEIKPHYESFIKEAEKRKVFLRLERLKSATITEDQTMPLGRCQGGHVIINLKKTYDDVCTLMVAAYHEFGHCILQLPHLNDGRLHIMQPKMEPSCAVYLYYWDTLLDEFFNYLN